MEIPCSPIIGMQNENGGRDRLLNSSKEPENKLVSWPLGAPVIVPIVIYSQRRNDGSAGADEKSWTKTSRERQELKVKPRTLGHLRTSGTGGDGALTAVGNAFTTWREFRMFRIYARVKEKFRGSWIIWERKGERERRWRKYDPARERFEDVA